MKRFPEDRSRKHSRITSDRHSDFNELMREHFCSPEKKTKKRGKKNNRRKK